MGPQRWGRSCRGCVKARLTAPPCPRAQPGLPQGYSLTELLLGSWGPAGPVATASARTRLSRVPADENPAVTASPIVLKGSPRDLYALQSDDTALVWRVCTATANPLRVASASPS